MMGNIEAGSTQKALMHCGPAPGEVVTMGSSLAEFLSSGSGLGTVLSSQQLSKAPGGSRNYEPGAWKRVGCG